MNQDNLDTHWLNDKQNMLYPIQWNIIQQLKDRRNDTCHNMDDP